jgi:hypothetical protein
MINTEPPTDKVYYLVIVMSLRCNAVRVRTSSTAGEFWRGRDPDGFWCFSNRGASGSSPHWLHLTPHHACGVWVPDLLATFC